MSLDGSLLLPNLGAEEGDDWRAYQREPITRIAARLWSHLYSHTTVLRTPSDVSRDGPEAWIERTVGDGWPETLGSPPAQAAYPWLEQGRLAVPWYRSASIDASLPEEERAAGIRIFGPSPDIVRRVHDKAFALESARALDLLPASLSSMIVPLSATDLGSPDRVVDTLTQVLARWPEWTRKRYTLKPRLGSSGRGRVAGVAEVDTPAIHGSLARLASRGGAIFEPWLERRCDLSVSLYLPEPTDAGALPTLLGSLEMLVTPSGVYRGHCGEFDHRGRIFSGHREDETLRAQAAALAARASALGYFGPCGIDAFTFVEDAASMDPERLRPALEFNARPTMGLVALGLLRRVIPRYRDALGIQPGERRAFLFSILDRTQDDASAHIERRVGGSCSSICLAGPEDDPEWPRPFLFLGPDLAALREAYRNTVGC